VPAVGSVRIVAPVVLRVIELAPVVMKASPKVTFLVAPAAIVNVSPPPNTIELVFSVVVSFAVRVLPAPRVNVPELTEIALPLIEVARAAPKVGVTRTGELEYTALTVPVVGAQDITPSALLCKTCSAMPLPVTAVKALAVFAASIESVGTTPDGKVEVVQDGLVPVLIKT
jgi:hypothetical protein